MRDIKTDAKNRLTGKYGDYSKCTQEIEFFLNNKSIGKSKLPDFTSENDRFDIAILLRIEDFDNFSLIRSNGEVNRASNITLNQLAVSGEDLPPNYAEACRIKYRRYLEAKNNPKLCPCCGQYIND